MEPSHPDRLSPISAYLKFPREPIRRHHSLKYIFNGESGVHVFRHGAHTPPSATPAISSYLSDKTRHHSLTRLKDLTSSVLSTRSREVTFTVPPTVSPLSPRRALGDCSPLSPRRLGSGDTTPVGSQAGSEYGGDSRTTTPSPGLLRGSFTDIPAVSGAACSLGSINPELYKTDELEGEYDQYPDDHIGRVWLQLEYLSDSEKLLVNLIKAKNLPSRLIGSINACDPYVRLYLMPDERRYLQTKTRRKTCNPRFDETFCFQITAKELEERALKLTFYDVDRDKKHQVIGHVLCLLKKRVGVYASMSPHRQMQQRQSQPSSLSSIKETRTTKHTSPTLVLELHQSGEDYRAHVPNPRQIKEARRVTEPLVDQGGEDYQAHVPNPRLPRSGEDYRAHVPKPKSRSPRELRRAHVQHPPKRRGLRRQAPRRFQGGHEVAAKDFQSLSSTKRRGLPSAPATFRRTERHSPPSLRHNHAYGSVLRERPISPPFHTAQNSRFKKYNNKYTKPTYSKLVHGFHGASERIYDVLLSASRPHAHDCRPISEHHASLSCFLLISCPVLPSRFPCSPSLLPSFLSFLAPLLHRPYPFLPSSSSSFLRFLSFHLPSFAFLLQFLSITFLPFRSLLLFLLPSHRLLLSFLPHFQSLPSPSSFPPSLQVCHKPTIPSHVPQSTSPSTSIDPSPSAHHRTENPFPLHPSSPTHHIPPTPPHPPRSPHPLLSESWSNPELVTASPVSQLRGAPPPPAAPPARAPHSRPIPADKLTPPRPPPHTTSPTRPPHTFTLLPPPPAIHRNATPIWTKRSVDRVEHDCCRDECGDPEVSVGFGYTAESVMTLLVDDPPHTRRINNQHIKTHLFSTTPHLHHHHPPMPSTGTAPPPDTTPPTPLTIHSIRPLWGLMDGSANGLAYSRHGQREPETERSGLTFAWLLLPRPSLSLLPLLSRRRTLLSTPPTHLSIEAPPVLYASSA
ncbi:putative synaptotagmin-15 isoform X2 [Penaeus vannamei]|uniref:Putative synaptotagmin-15 isoform X2 n=1 Tax=Penaeus vannamei TaxID=6689 RepID=A0A3R7QWQ1_PENVA|nr:putative synaptotagmin-15 isoform X2 [Penaeus vannamei]